MNEMDTRFANQYNIQWFPGHMTKTLRMMEQEIQHVDASLVLLDARIPLSSLNPEIERITDRKPKLYALNKADLADPAVTEEWIRYFHAADAGCVAISAKQKGGANAVKVAIEKELSGLLERLVGLLVGRDSGKDSKSSLAAIGTLYEILGCLIEYGRSKSSAKVSPDSGVGQILIYVNHHYTEKLSPAALSAQFGYHEAYFCRRFRELTGITFSEYVRALRMEYAQKLLKESEDEVGTVAWKCGYPDGSYFTCLLYTSDAADE